MELSNIRGVRFGIVEHAGSGQRIGDDEALSRYVKDLEDYPVYKGIQAEGLDWMACFSGEAVAQLDYVLTDALTFPEKDGRRIQLWTPQVHIEDAQDFMDRYVAFHVQIMAGAPIDIMANLTFLPGCIADQYEVLWTEERMHRIIQAAVEYDVAFEINARYQIPNATFIRMAKRAGSKFSFGSNTHSEEVGRLEYCVNMAKECGLTGADMFMPNLERK